MKKVFILITDGIGIRNFAQTNFYEKASKKFNVIFWNATNFPLYQSFGFKEIKIPFIKNHPLTSIIKNSKIQYELNLFSKKFSDSTYLSYLFPLKPHSWKGKLKTILSKFIYLYASLTYKKDSQFFLIWLKYWERKTSTYKYALEILKKEKPEIIFIPNQRASKALPFLTAAQDLKIPVLSFIFSWDNLPKATLVLDADYYFVWSEHMKEELLKYYPFIEENKIFITGTPQFEPHFDKNILLNKKEFFDRYSLDLSKKYITFTGDDVVTSPYDQYYLRDLAISVRKYNATHDNKFGIIFRRVPVDFSGRYNNIIKEFNDIIIEIPPAWKPYGKNWDEILPEKEDWRLLVNILHHSEAVFNIGSSIVFDSIIHNKPCFFIRYNTQEVDLDQWNIENIYNFIHFKTMPSNKSVLWIKDQKEYNLILEDLSNGKNYNLDETYLWFEKIVAPPAQISSQRIIKSIESIINE